MHAMRSADSKVVCVHALIFFQKKTLQNRELDLLYKSGTILGVHFSASLAFLLIIQPIPIKLTREISCELKTEKSNLLNWVRKMETW